MLVERCEDAADRGVHRLHHAGVDRVGLRGAVLTGRLGSEGVGQLCGLLAAAVFLNQGLRGHQRCVHRIKGNVGQERLAGMLFNKGSRFLGQPGRQVLTVRAIVEPWVAVGRKIFLASIGAAPFDAAAVDIKAMVFRPGAFRAKVPLAGEEGGVAVGLEGFGERGVAGGQLAEIGGGPERPVGMAAEAAVAGRVVVCREGLAQELIRGAEVVGVAGAGGPLAGHHGGPRW